MMKHANPMPRVQLCLLLIILSFSVRAWPTEVPLDAAEHFVQFPTYSAKTLNKDRVEVPAGLRGDTKLVLLAFYREQQEMVNTWLDDLAGFEEEFSTFAYYEFPVIQRRQRLEL